MAATKLAGRITGLEVSAVADCAVHSTEPTKTEIIIGASAESLCIAETPETHEGRSPANDPWPGSTPREIESCPRQDPTRWLSRLQATRHDSRPPRARCRCFSPLARTCGAGEWPTHVSPVDEFACPRVEVTRGSTPCGWCVRVRFLDSPCMVLKPLHLNLLLINVQIYDTVSCVISKKPRCVLSLHLLYLLSFVPFAH